MTIDVGMVGRGVMSKTAVNSRKSRLEPIEHDVNVDLVSKNGKCIRFQCSEFPDLFAADWNKEYDEIERVNTVSFKYPTYKYSKVVYIYDDITVERYSFTFFREFFAEKNIINYRHSLEKIIKIKTGVI